MTSLVCIHQSTENKLKTLIKNYCINTKIVENQWVGNFIMMVLEGLNVEGFL
jgi:superfamily I DNA and RNA helicase